MIDHRAFLSALRIEPRNSSLERQTPLFGRKIDRPDIIAFTGTYLDLKGRF